MENEKETMAAGSFFDEAELAGTFKFSEIDAQTSKEISRPAIFKNPFICQAPNENSQKGFYGLFPRYIVRYKDGSYNNAESVLTIANSSLKILLPSKNNKMFGFSIERHGSTLLFGSLQEELINEWFSAMRRICVLDNFHEEYKAFKMIGKGSFAKVYLVESKSSKKLYAVKAFVKESVIASDQSNAKPSMINEIDIMRALDHDNIIKLHEVYETDKSIYLVVDLIQGKSLDAILKKPTFKMESSPVRVFNLIRGILDALAYLAYKGIMHRDLKPENILIDKDDTVKIVDFGLATVIDIPNYIFKKCGTPGYIAPEVFKFDQKNKSTRYDGRADVFSAGCILYYMLFGTPFFKGTGASEILNNNRGIAGHLKNLAQIKQEFANPEGIINKEGLDLLLQLLEMEPKKRVTAADSLNHAFFSPSPMEMQRVPNSNVFYAEALSKYNQNEIVLQYPRNIFMNESGSPTNDSSPRSFNSPDRLSMSPTHSPQKRFTVKDSMYLDVGRPDFNGRVDTLTNGSQKDSVILRGRSGGRSNTTGNYTFGGAAMSPMSSFAKSPQSPSLSPSEGRQMRGSGHRLSVNMGNSHSILKAAIFRNMQKNTNSISEEGEINRRGSIDLRLARNQSDQKVRYTSKNDNSEDESDEIRQLSLSPSRNPRQISLLAEKRHFQFPDADLKVGRDDDDSGKSPTTKAKKFLPFNQ